MTTIKRIPRKFLLQGLKAMPMFKNDPERLEQFIDEYIESVKKQRKGAYNIDVTEENFSAAKQFLMTQIDYHQFLHTVGIKESPTQKETEKRAFIYAGKLIQRFNAKKSSI